MDLECPLYTAAGCLLCYFAVIADCNFSLDCNFFEHEQQQLYLVTLLIPSICPMVSVVVEMSLTSGNVCLKGSASLMVYKLSCFGVFKYL